MKHLHRILLLPLIALVLAAVTGCGHTNNLAKYNLREKTVLYRTYVTGSGSSIAIVQSPAKHTNVAIDIAAAIGSGIISDQARKKLERAVQPDSIAGNISLGMRQAVSDYTSLHAVESISSSPDFLVETELTKYELVSTSVGISASVTGNSRMIDRATGGIVWENSETHTIPLSETFLAILGSPAVQSGVSIFNAVRLLNLTDEELRTVINTASMLAGREIGETLRKDIAASHGK